MASKLTGSSSAEIEAPLDAVWAVIADVESAPSWQGGMESLTAEQRDADGRPTLCEAVADAKIRKIKSKVRFDYGGAPTRLSWKQEKGELKALDGAWVLEDLGGGRTKATYELEVDLGMILGALVKGPAEAAVRAALVSARADELKRHLEGTS